jgi:hypothetical protein
LPFFRARPILLSMYTLWICVKRHVAPPA